MLKHRTHTTIIATLVLLTVICSSAFAREGISAQAAPADIQGASDTIPEQGAEDVGVVYPFLGGGVKIEEYFDLGVPIFSFGAPILTISIIGILAAGDVPG